MEYESLTLFFCEVNMDEIWKDVKDFEGLYQVSNRGRVRSLDKKVCCGIKNNPEVVKKGRILNPLKTGSNYLFVQIYKNRKPKIIFIHRLVAQAFIPNPNNYSIVNHRDENPLNNDVDNLEWCNQSYNINYGNRNRKVAEKLKNYPKFSHKVIQKTLDGKIIKSWESISEANRVLNIQRSGIAKCCMNKLKTSGGYLWEYDT